MIGIVTLIQFGAAMYFTVLVRPKGPADSNLRLYPRIDLISGMVCDIAVSASLIYYFHSFRLRMTRTDIVLQELIVLSINMCVLLCLVTAVALALFELNVGTAVPLAPHMIVYEIYTNSFIATLNTRKHFRALADRTVDFTLPSTTTGDTT